MNKFIKNTIPVIIYYIVFTFLISISFGYNAKTIFIAFCLAWFSGILNDILRELKNNNK